MTERESFTYGAYALAGLALLGGLCFGFALGGYRASFLYEPEIAEMDEELEQARASLAACESRCAREHTLSKAERYEIGVGAKQVVR